MIVGGGHNGLVAAAYLAGRGMSTLLLERLPHTGGAAVSKQAFPGVGARLSRYSYLVSMMPQELIEDLDLSLDLRSRSVASYTPVQRDGRDLGLFVERPEGDATAASFRALTGGDDEYAAWQRFYSQVTGFAEVVAPTFLQPLETERAIRERVDPEIWSALVERPLGDVLRERFTDDTVRGVVGTDGLIGTFASLDDPSRIQNRCFLYHLVGNGTGEWRVPVGGMGAVTDALRKAAVEAGAEIHTGAGVSRVESDGTTPAVIWHDGVREHFVNTTWVLSNVAPWVLQILLGEEQPPESKPEGAQLKINFLLDRLPRLKSGDDPAKAFAGTFHVAEDLTQLEAAYADAAAGRVPEVMPGELYCHSLTDPSILDESLVRRGSHTLTYFGLHTPAALFEKDPQGARDAAVKSALAAINAYLVDPIEDCLAKDSAGKPCLEAKIPQDVEADLAMPGGHIFHGDLSWPWAPNRSLLDTPARQWGVNTELPNVLLCGSGARRGGAVSGLGGHNAAQAILASSVTPDLTRVSTQTDTRGRATRSAPGSAGWHSGPARS